MSVAVAASAAAQTSAGFAFKRRQRSADAITAAEYRDRYARNVRKFAQLCLVSRLALRTRNRAGECFEVIHAWIGLRD
jgi:hypothetical protein